jgi:hypothetical protein
MIKPAGSVPQCEGTLENTAIQFEMVEPGRILNIGLSLHKWSFFKPLLRWTFRPTVAFWSDAAAGKLSEKLAGQAFAGLSVDPRKNVSSPRLIFVFCMSILFFGQESSLRIPLMSFPGISCFSFI